MKEKRKTPRIQPFVASCRFVAEGDQRVPGFITNLSSQGACINTDVEVPAAGSAITVEVRIGRQATHLRLPAIVRWERRSSRGGFAFGVSFEEIGPEEQKVLDGVIEEFRRRAEQLA